MTNSYEQVENGVYVDGSRCGTMLLQVAAGGLLLLMMARMGTALSRQSRLSHESGVWTALAMDAAQGVIYRPLIGPLGYGGTRYFPLQFVLHGLLIRAGFSPIHAGYVVLVSSAILLLASMYWFMRRLGVAAGLAMPICVLAMGTAAADMALTMIRGDLLPAALNLLALAICAGFFQPKRSMFADDKVGFGRVVLAGVIFAMAFLAKITTVFGLLAVVIALWMHGGQRRRYSILLAALFGVIAIGGLWMVQWASHGNFYLNLRACAGGDAGGVMWALKRLPSFVADVFIAHDPLGFAVAVLGISVFCAASWQWRLELPGILFLMTAAVTVSLFLTPGIDKNHLLDLQIVCLVLMALRISQGAGESKMILVSLTVFAVAAMTGAWLGLMGDFPYRARAYTQLARTAVGGESGPILSDFALLPVLRGESPFLLDDFMLPLICSHDPEIRRDLYVKLDRGFFSAVVLKADPLAEHERKVWGNDFMKHLLAGYVQGTSSDGFLIYRRQRGSR